MTLLRIAIPPYVLLSMIFPENRYPLFRITLYCACLGSFGRKIASRPIAGKKAQRW
jgi:hypothetical protein